LLEQDSLVNRKRRALYPVVMQRQQLADALARYMTQVGLERRKPAMKGLEEYVTERYTRTVGAQQFGSASRLGRRDGSSCHPRRERHGGPRRSPRT
jgi:hypothetical protein